MAVQVKESVPRGAQSIIRSGAAQPYKDKNNDSLVNRLSRLYDKELSI